MRLFVLFALALPITAFAENCGWNSDHSYFGCGGFYNGSDSGSSAPTLDDALAVNPASLPTVPTPIGVEVSYSSRSARSNSSGFSYTTLKGFKGLAFALGSWTDGTFSSPNYYDHFVGTSYQALYQATQVSPPSGVRGGTTLAAPGFLIPKGTTLKVGASADSGHVTGHLDPQISLEAGLLGLTIGYTYGSELLSLQIPRVFVSTVSVGWRLSQLYLGYSNETLTGGGVPKTSSNTGTLRWTGDAWALWGSEKRAIDQIGRSDNWTQGGFSWRANSHFSLSYQYGQFRYSHGAVLQFYL